MKKYLFIFLLQSAALVATEFTVASYNCGALSNHYDYLRGVAMEKVMHERYVAEPELMSINEKIQKCALQRLFATNSTEAEKEWVEQEYEKQSAFLIRAPYSENSPNTLWNQKSEETMTEYRTRPIVIHDQELKEKFTTYLDCISKKKELEAQITEVREVMAKEIFAHSLNQDCLCLQEADYLNSSLFPKHYAVLFSPLGAHSDNGVAWNTNRFTLISYWKNIADCATAVLLSDQETGATVLLTSLHLAGCNPYHNVNDDAANGDEELRKTLSLLNEIPSDIKLIGMDANVTSLHPRLQILKEDGYQIDCDHHFELTCTNPYQILNTRIDWIAIKGVVANPTITNIPILSVGLNQMQTNISDHKPIAAKIGY